MQAVESNVSRRRLLGAALTLGAGATIGSTLSFPSLGVPVSAAGGRELVHGELIRQLKQGVRDMRGPHPGEAARSVAGTLRVLAAHYKAAGVDAQFKSGLRAAIARDGREAVLRWESAPAISVAEAREFGVTAPLPREPFNLADRERTLDELLRNGCTPMLLAVAAELSRRAPLLDRMGVTPAATRPCPNTRGMVLTAGYVAAAERQIHPGACPGFMGALLGLEVGLSVGGC